MKQIIKLVVCLFSISCALVSCFSDGKDKVNYSEAYYFDRADTLQVKSLCDEFMTLVQRQDYEAAMTNLHYLSEAGDVAELPESVKEDLLNELKHFPVLDYSMDSYTFKEPDKVEVVYKVKFMDKPADEPNFPDSYRLVFSPSRVNGEWFLMMAEKAIN